MIGHSIGSLIGLLIGLSIGLFIGLLIHSLDWSLDVSFLVAVMIESISVKTRISAPAHPSATVFLFHLVTFVGVFCQWVGQSVTFEKWLSSITFAENWWR